MRPALALFVAALTLGLVPPGDASIGPALEDPSDAPPAMRNVHDPAPSPGSTCGGPGEADGQPPTPVDAIPATTLDPCAGTIRPGIHIDTPHTGCTAGFVFRDAQNRSYLATAGHCFGARAACEDTPATRVSAEDIGPFGTKVLCVHRGIGHDLALVLIDEDKESLVSPEICHWGGPSGSDGPVDMDAVRYYGQGIGLSATEQTRARTGTLMAHDAQSFRMIGAVISGDSGAPVRMDDGSAVGIITHANGNVLDILAVSAPYGYGTSVDRIIDAAAGINLELHLATSS